MENMILCQSCAMPLTKPEDYGTNSDGSKNEDYCAYCYKDGAFVQDCTLDEMIATCAKFASSFVPPVSEDEAKKQLGAVLPTLKRWK